MEKFNQSILVVHAHPDDTEAFCAGSLACLQKEGWEIHIATLTAGGMGGIGSTEVETEKRRKEEARKAAEVIGGKYYCLGGRDGFLMDTPEIRVEVTALMRRIKPGVVMTHLPFDYHSDHRTTCNITEVAALMTTLPNHPSEEPPLERTPLLYHTAPFTFSDTLGAPITPPHFFLNITEVMDKKMEMLAFHESQIELMRVMHKMDNFFEEMAQYNVDLGKMVGCKYAEVYWQHLGGGFQKAPLLQEVLHKKIILKEGE
ncbi:MAG: PIG-L family deacetylase [Spirochaetales bacterium]|nr:PIG-L family deacetylase [Spirochaetales bacterium]